jgi:hypothetical protein
MYLVWQAVFSSGLPGKLQRRVQSSLPVSYCFMLIVYFFWLGNVHSRRMPHVSPKRLLYTGFDRITFHNSRITVFREAGLAQSVLRLATGWMTGVGV